jgi:acyl-CoA synthetase (AMP-forming)/AMP-acid ligase II
VTREGSSIQDLFRLATRWKQNGLLLADDEERLSGGEAAQLVARVAGSLASLGVRPGVRVATLTGSSVRHAISFFACLHLGAVPCALHVRETVSSLVDTIEWLDAGVLITDRQHSELAAHVLEASTTPIQVRSLSDTPSSYVASTFSDLAGGPALAPASVSPDAPALVLLSSGTTGAPKGVVHTQRTLAATALAGPAIYGDVRDHHSVLVPMSPSFAAWINVVLPFIAHRAAVVFQRRFDPEEYLRRLAVESITFAPLPPTMWRLVLTPAVAKDDLKLESVFYSGEPGTPDLISSFKAAFGAVNIRTALLSSEGGCASGVVADIDTLLHRRKPTSTGRPVPGADVRLLAPSASERATEQSPGAVGEIVLRSASLAIGYWQDERLSSERFVDGWWHSGDLGFVDDDGDVFVVGRTDNVINSGGVKMHAEEIEAALLHHPAVRMVAVVGVPDERWGQLVEAHVVVADANVTPDDILAFCREEGTLASAKIPKRVIVRDALPTGPTGKLYRKGLLER